MNATTVTIDTEDHIRRGTVGSTFEITVLSDDADAAVSVTCIDDEVYSDDVTWPTDEQIAEVVGARVHFVDAGDHPTRAEAIYRKARTTYQSA